MTDHQEEHFPALLVKACRAFGVEVKEIHPLPGHEPRYRITGERQQFLLSMQHTEDSSLLDHFRRQMVSLAYFLTYMRRKTALPLPEPLLTDDDELTFIEGSCCFSMLTWVEGEPIPALNQFHSFQMGSIMATLHHGQRGFERAEEFTRPWSTPDHLRHSWYRIKHHALLNPEDIARIEALLANRSGYRYRSKDDLPDEGLIHGDFKLQNCVQHQGKMRIVDFEQLRHDGFLDDLAIAFLGINDPRKKHRFLEGYLSVAPLPVDLERCLDRVYFVALIRMIGTHDRALHRPEWIRKEAPRLAQLAKRLERGESIALD